MHTPVFGKPRNESDSDGYGFKFIPEEQASILNPEALIGLVAEAMALKSLGFDARESVVPCYTLEPVEPAQIGSSSSPAGDISRSELGQIMDRLATIERTLNQGRVKVDEQGAQIAELVADTGSLRDKASSMEEQIRQLREFERRNMECLRLTNPYLRRDYHSIPIPYPPFLPSSQQLR